ncbi:MAG: alpha/beta hydrolase-fold protein [Actinomycetota bacterium]|nr:alpha/beta hydrolase-fold protein [Actinomycetota bacterium]
MQADLEEVPGRSSFDKEEYGGRQKAMGERTISRQHFLKLAGGAAGAASFGFLTAPFFGGKTAAASQPVEQMPKQRREVAGRARRGRLLARPGPPAAGVTMSVGLYKLGLGSRRDGLLYVPKGYRAGQKVPLVLVLHGSISDARRGISPFLDPADEAGLVLLAPDSRDRRDWDIFFPGHYGPDVRFIDRALEQVFDRFAVDADKLAVMGFSDGASYALSLGLTNGDLFTHVAAFAPGLVAPAAYRGEPSVFIAHGLRDEVLDIDKTSRRIVPWLERKGYAGRYVEFDGGHTVSPSIAEVAVDWVVK